MYHNRQIVTTVGTPVQVSPLTDVWSQVTFQALFANTGYVAIGGATVRASDGSQNALLIKGGTSLERQTFTNVRLCDLWIDATVANDGVAFVAE